MNDITINLNDKNLSIEKIDAIVSEKLDKVSASHIAIICKEELINTLINKNDIIPHEYNSEVKCINYNHKIYSLIIDETMDNNEVTIHIIPVHIDIRLGTRAVNNNGSTLSVEIYKK
jgi:hypothetical protein